MTAALATEPLPTDPQLINHGPHPFPEPPPSTVAAVHSVQPVRLVPAPSARSSRAQAGQPQSVRDPRPVQPDRSSLPYLDSVPVSEPPFDDEIATGGGSPTGRWVLERPGGALITSVTGGGFGPAHLGVPTRPAEVRTQPGPVPIRESATIPADERPAGRPRTVPASVNAAQASAAVSPRPTGARLTGTAPADATLTGTSLTGSTITDTALTTRSPSRGTTIIRTTLTGPAHAVGGPAGGAAVVPAPTIARGRTTHGRSGVVDPPSTTGRRTTHRRTGVEDPPSTTGRRTAIGASGVPAWSSESDVGVRRTSTQALPPAMRTGQVFARALVEILSGRRPLAQLRVHCAPDIYAGLLERPMPSAVCLPHLLTVRVCEPADGAAEVSAAFRRAQRVRAIAFRMQGVDGRWRITALEVG